MYRQRLSFIMDTKRSHQQSVVCRFTLYVMGGQKLKKGRNPFVDLQMETMVYKAEMRN